MGPADLASADWLRLTAWPAVQRRAMCPDAAGLGVSPRASLRSLLLLTLAPNLHCLVGHGSVHAEGRVPHANEQPSLVSLEEADTLFLGGNFQKAAALYSQALDHLHSAGHTADEAFLSHAVALLFAGVPDGRSPSISHLSASRAELAQQFFSRHLHLLCEQTGQSAPARLRELGDVLFAKRCFLAVQAYDKVWREYADAPFADYCAYRAAYSRNVHSYYASLASGFRQAQERYRAMLERYPRSAYRDDAAEQLGRIAVALLCAASRAAGPRDEGAPGLDERNDTSGAGEKLKREAEQACAESIALLKTIRHTYRKADRMEACLRVY